MRIRPVVAFLTLVVSPALAFSSADNSSGGSALLFEPNHGQTDPAVRYLVRTPGGVVFLTSTEMVLHRDGSRQGDPENTVRFTIAGADPQAPWEPAGAVAGTTSYILGRDPSKWVRGVPAYQRLVRRNVYPGVDLVFYGAAGKLEYDFVLAPQADPSRIRIRVDGHRAMRVNPSGALVMETAAGEVIQRKPVLYQTSPDGARTEVEGAFQVLGKSEAGFRVGGYDRDAVLAIDPVIESSTYLGGSWDDSIVATDKNGQFVGTTASIDFPGASFARRKGRDIVFRYAPSYYGQVTVVLGGSGDDQVTSAAFSSYYQMVVIGGTTDSKDLPTNPNIFTPGVTNEAWQREYAGGATDGFVIILGVTSNRTTILCTYFGTPGDDRVTGVAAYPYGNSFAIVGTTTAAGLPAPLPAYYSYWPVEPLRREPAGGVDGFLALGYDSRLQATGYFGGSGDDQPLSVSSAAGTTASGWFVTGETRSQDFPLINPVSSQRNGDSDAFLIRVQPSSAKLEMAAATLIGGAGTDRGTAVTVLRNKVAVAGVTSSTDLPVSDAAQQAYGGGDSDAFLMQFTSDMSRMVSGTYLGGSGADEAAILTSDSLENLFLAGRTTSTDFPVAGALQPSFGGGPDDGFIAQYTDSGTVRQATYFGGSGSDRILGLTVSPNSVIWVAGETTSPDLPLKDASQGSLRGSSDGFIARLSWNLISVGRLTGAKGFRSSSTLYLDAAIGQAGVTVTSSDPEKVLVAGSTIEAGAGSTILPWTPSYAQGSRPFYIDCLVDQGGADITFSAPDREPRTVRAECFPARLVAYSSPSSITVWSRPATIYLSLQTADPNYFLPLGQLTLPPGKAPIVVAIANSNPAVGQLSADTMTIGKPDVSPLADFSPLSVGETELTFTTDAVPETTRLTVKVTSPLTASRTVTVPSGFSGSTNILNTSMPAAPVTATVTSGDPNLVLVSNDGKKLGTGSLALALGTSYGYMYVQAIGSSGETPVTISVPGLPPETLTVRVVPPVATLVSSADPSKPVPLALGATLNLTPRVEPAEAPALSSAVLNPGREPLEFTLESSHPEVAGVTAATVVMQPGEYAKSFTVRGVSAGSSELTLRPPEGIPLREGSRPVAVEVKTGTLALEDIELGKDLTASMRVTLPSPAPAYLSVRITTDKPELVLVSSNAQLAGSSAATYTVNPGAAYFVFFVQGLAAAGQANITAEVPGYGTVSGKVTLAPSGFGWTADTYNTTLYSAPNYVSVSPFALDATSLFPVAQQYLRPGVSAKVPFANSNPDVVSFEKSTVDLNPAVPYGSASGVPRSLGDTVLTLTQPEGFSTPSIRQRLAVHVGKRSLRISPITVAKDTESYLGIDDIPYGVKQPLTVTSGDPSRLLVTTDPAVPGSPSVTISDPQNRGPLYVQALDGSGYVTVTASMPTFNDTPVIVSLVPAGISITADTSGGSRSTGTASFGTTTQSPPTSLTLSLWAVSPVTGQVVVRAERLRPGMAPLEAEVIASDTAVGAISGSPARFSANPTPYAQARFTPAGTGTTDITVLQPPGFVAPQGQTKITITVAAPQFVTPKLVVGRDTFAAAYVEIPDNVSPMLDLPITITSPDPSRVLLSPDVNAPPAPSILKVIPAGQRRTGNFYVHALGGDGMVPLALSAPEFAEGALQVDLVETRFGFTQDTPVRAVVQAGRQRSAVAARLENTASYYYPQAILRPGVADIPITIRSSDEKIVRIDTPVLALKAGMSYAEFSWTPLAPGSATITMELPPDRPLWQGHDRLDVNAEGAKLNIWAYGKTIGRDLQTRISVGSEALFPQQGITVTSSDPSKLLVSPDATSLGQASIRTSGGGSQQFYVQSLADNGTSTVTVSADGYQSAAVELSLGPAAAVFQDGSGPFTMPQNSGPRRVCASLGALDSSTLKPVSSDQTARPGASLTATIDSSDPKVLVVDRARLQFPDQNCANLLPAGVGKSTVSLGPLPNGPTAAAGRQAVFEVQGPDLSFPSFTLGRDLQVPVQVTLASRLYPPSSDLTLFVTTSDVNLIGISNDSSVPGASYSTTVIVPAGQRISKPFYVQALAETGKATIRVMGGGYQVAEGVVTLARTGFVFKEASQSQPVGVAANSTATFTLLPAVVPLDSPVLSPLMIRAGAAPIIVNVGSSSPNVLTIVTPQIRFAPGDRQATLTVRGAATGRAMLTLWGNSYEFSTPYSSLNVEVR